MTGTRAEIREIMAILEGGDVVGSGPGMSGAGRLQALQDMVKTAGDLLRMDEIESACGQLEQVRGRTDGLFPPSDFLEPGAATDEVNARIEALQQEFSCNPKPVPACGIGGELALLLPPLLWLRRARKRHVRDPASRRTCRTPSGTGAARR